MSRPLIIEYPDAWYHVMNRGRRAENIFLDKTDYTIFLELLIESAVCKAYNVDEEDLLSSKRETFN